MGRPLGHQRQFCLPGKAAEICNSCQCRTHKSWGFGHGKCYPVPSCQVWDSNLSAIGLSLEEKMKSLYGFYYELAQLERDVEEDRVSPEILLSDFLEQQHPLDLTKNRGGEAYKAQ